MNKYRLTDYLLRVAVAVGAVVGARAGSADAASGCASGRGVGDASGRGLLQAVPQDPAPAAVADDGDRDHR